MTITLNIKENSKSGKVFLEFLKSYVSQDKDIEILDDSGYNPFFVEKINRAQKEYKEGKTVTIKHYKLWESLGLK